VRGTLLALEAAVRGWFFVQEVPMPRSLIHTTIALAALSVGCGNEHDIHVMDFEDSFYQSGTDMVDMLWVIDDSNSMANEQFKVAGGFEQFIFAMGLAEDMVDFHLGVITTDMDTANEERGLLVGEPAYLTRDDDYLFDFMDRVQVGTQGSDKERGLQAAYHALTDPDALDQNDGFLRGEAVLALIFVSDENDCSDDNWLSDDMAGSLCYDINDKLTSTAEYIRRFQAVKGIGGRVVASTIVGPEVAEGCDESWPGKRYMTLANELDGVNGNICEADYNAIMDDIGSRITAPQRTFYLSYTPVEESLAVFVDEEEIVADDRLGWVYDDEFVSVEFEGDYVPEFGSTITIQYDIAGNK
jgi:hypothetical protein